VAERTQRLVGAAKKLPVPEGTYVIGLGLVLAGFAAYGFQILAAKQLSEQDYAALNVLWAIVFVAAPGLFQPLEQEVARALAHRRAQGVGGAPLVKRAAILGGVLAVGVALAAAIAHTPIVDHLFNGRTVLLYALFASLGTYYVAHTTRGVLSGNGRFAPYGMMHGSEGVVRMLIVVGLVALGATLPGWYGFALAIPPLFAVAIALRGQRNLMVPGPPAPYSELSNALAWLLVGSVLAQFLSYASVLTVQILASPEQKELVAGFITGLFIARVPLLLFQAVQAALLPKLSRLASEGKHDDFRAGMRKLIVVVIVICVSGIVAATALGPWAGNLLFPSKWTLGNGDMFMLTAGATGFILALTLSQGLIALKGYAQAAVAWIVGIVGFVVAVWLVDDLFLRAETGFVVGSAIAAALMGVLLWRLMHTTRGASLEDLVEIVEHETLEI